MKAGKVHVEMIYRLDFVPAGIMSWFIVRTHRYTRKLHWREGVILSYQDHWARVELFARRNELRLEAWGVEPRTFLVILKETVDLILSRFEGLQVSREDNRMLWLRLNQLCEWNVRQFTRLWNLEMRKMEAECPNTFYIVPGSTRNSDNQSISELKLFPIVAEIVPHSS